MPYVFLDDFDIPTINKEEKKMIEKVMTFCVKLHDGDVKFMPVKSFPSDAGFDISARSYCAINSGKLRPEVELLAGSPIKLRPTERILIKTGVYLELTEGWEAQVRCRSGIALKYGITITNSPGTIDASYRNEVGVILQNTSDMDFSIDRYDRVAQLVIKEVPNVKLIQVKELNTTDRNLGGFGSTGK